MKVLKKTLISANFYLILFKENAVLIDTGDPHSKTRVLNFLKKNLGEKKLSYILITHSHWDHIGNVEFLKSFFSSKVLISKKESQWVKKGYIDIPSPKGTFYSIILYNFLQLFSRFENINKFEPDIEVSKYEVLEVEDKRIEIFLSPGHTPGSLIFRIEKYAFIGDILIGPNVFIKRPRPSMFLHNREDIFKSINFLKNLDAEIYFPGHGVPFKKENLIDFHKTTSPVQK